MNSIPLLSLVFLSLVLLSSPSRASDIVNLSADNFDSVVDGSKFVFVKFFAPWCGHCKAMAPAWDQLATALKEETDVVIADVDATIERDLGTRFEVRGYPTLKFFRKGSKDAEAYQFGRNVEALLEFVNKEAGTFRMPDGSLSPDAGPPEWMLEAFAAARTCTGGSVECKDALAKARGTEGPSAEDDPAGAVLADFFVKFVGKFIDEGKSPAPLKKESERLSRILSGGSVDPAKKGVMSKKNLILVKLLETLEGGGRPAEEEDDDEKDEL
uniref:protein disulfide-isomerase n=1 Tax=Chromera velia CCMP2878 TaxID=1169474 RepID=A0A0G4HSF3_9ALVE|mmetsp:Transcript_42636/g.84098  ORF Transcript_42636/g.84098 Transcript_42636/m.84098 type:complete len:270 (+) Transcript_42636:260-1069(+)|eukprot:Cvel_8285.t1-p1 / transcript=Cvel_8285.t1 / gene=Cvel_8285 / organism=Chromera_velia_CCMP2878 / gene_product=Probable protein disulfide-isomerase A6, putative / transcript_product=Probable protein disulfide-isomerase A6, putative / location=Cvel_scaffold454:68664-71096(-) / protein_length=269 / sequence_SO=supercontig / SO=protein_coding / is_pseudo=false